MNNSIQESPQSKKHKVLENRFKWVPIAERKIKWGPMPPRKKEIRLPLLWLAGDGNELYLVNSSGETFDSVVAGSGGFQTIDDNAVSVSTDSSYKYQNIKPNDAVKVDEFDGFYDLDFHIQASLIVKSERIGHVVILTSPKKGGIGETVLLWDSMESGKNVLSISNYE